jgi:hypothetical protein
MLPSQVGADSFDGYPPQGHALAVENLGTIQRVPVPFAALLISQVIVYDWLFPAERKAMDDQFAYLRSLSAADFERSVQGFSFPALESDLEKDDWVQRPGEYVEAFTAALWSSHQIDRFRAAATAFSDAWRKVFPEPEPITARLAIVVLGKDLHAASYPLFRKLIPNGVHVQAVDPADAWPAILETAAARANQFPLPYGHWYIDGGTPPPGVDPRLSAVTWTELGAARAAILRRMQSVIHSGHGGPEELRTLMAETTTREVGLDNGSGDETLRRFKLRLLAEGSGTQIFSTTFVQWSARECLRRAQPCTLLLHFQTRQRQLPMNELLAGTGDRNAVDPAGSLVDADMGAYYTWIDQRRLTGAARASLIAWSEARGEAIVIGPNAPRGATTENAITMRKLFAQFL